MACKDAIEYETRATTPDEFQDSCGMVTGSDSVDLLSHGSADDIDNPLESINGGTSRVLLMNSVVRGVTEIDLLPLVQPFSRMKPKIFIHPTNGYAFIEFLSNIEASDALTYMSQNPIILKGSKIEVCYSRRQSVQHAHDLKTMNRTILISVCNLVFAMDLTIFYKICSPFGTVQKIVTFNSAPTMLQAIVQFSNVNEARAALNGLHNQNIYDGCNTLQVLPSKREEILVRRNGERSWDYTIDPAGPPGIITTTEQENEVHKDTDISKQIQNATIYDSENSLNSNSHRNILNQNMYSIYSIPNCTNTYSNIEYASKNPRDDEKRSKYHEKGNKHKIVDSMWQEIFKKLPANVEVKKSWELNPNECSVVICYNVPTFLETEHLFNLFSCYGHVSRIKIMFNKPDSVLVQYSDPIFATVATLFMSNVEIFGRHLELHFSTINDIRIRQTEATGEHTARKTLSFSEESQRFRAGQIDRYVKGVCIPHATLFISNVPVIVGVQGVVAAFNKISPVQKFKGVEKQPSELPQLKHQPYALNLLIQFHTTADAIYALMVMHNSVFHDTRIKVSFAKGSISH